MRVRGMRGVKRLKDKESLKNGQMKMFETERQRNFLECKTSGDRE